MFLFSVNGTQRNPVLLACEKSEEKQATAVDEFLHHPFQAEAELNNVESSNSDSVLVTPESPVSVISPVLSNNSASSDVLGNNYVTSELPVPVIEPVPEPQQKRTIYVHRLNIKRDMIDLFRDPLIMGQDIEIIVMMLGESKK